MPTNPVIRTVFMVSGSMVVVVWQVNQLTVALRGEIEDGFIWFLQLSSISEGPRSSPTEACKNVSSSSIQAIIIFFSLTIISVLSTDRLEYEASVAEVTEDGLK